MKKPRHLGFVLAAAVFSAGCGGSPLPIGTANVAVAAPQYKISTPLVYVSSFAASYVKVFRGNESDPRSLVKISKGVDHPNGDCIDAQGTLYVVNEESSVTEYTLGKPKLVKTITAGLYTPGFCAIDGDGDLWVSDLGDRFAFVREYKPGATKPAGVIRNGLVHPTGVAFDPSGNMYVANLQPYSQSTVQVYAPGENSPSRTITDGIHWPLGIAVDKDGTLYVTNDSAPCNVEEYRAGQSHPYRTITEGINGPSSVAIGTNGWLYVVDEGIQGCSGPSSAVVEFAPGSMKPAKREIKKELFDPVGGAVYPPLLPPQRR